MGDPWSRLSAVLLLTWMVQGCAAAYPVDTQVQAMPGAAFGSYRSYAQAPPPWEHPVVGERVKQEIAAALEAKGYREMPLQEADLVIVFRGRGERVERRVKVPDPDTFYYTKLQRYVEGTLEIDAFHAGREHLVWRGFARVDIFSEADREAREGAAQAVRAILRDFPPAPAEPAS